MSDINGYSEYYLLYPLISFHLIFSFRLRIRVKGLQHVIDSQGTKIASLLTEREMASLGHADESTGQGTLVSTHINR